MLDHDWPKLPVPKIQAEDQHPIIEMLGVAEVDFDWQRIFANHRVWKQIWLEFDEGFDTGSENDRIDVQVRDVFKA